jgi:hypothetical protein
MGCFSVDLAREPIGALPKSESLVLMCLVRDLNV